MNSDLLRLLEKLYGVRLHLSICPLLWLLSQLTMKVLIGFFCTHAGKYAQVTNNPENDGCINAVLLV